MSDTRTDFTDVLRAAAPIGTTVFVQTVRPGHARLWVETGSQTDPTTHRVVNPTGTDHITHRFALTVGLPYDDGTDTVEAEPSTIVGRLSLYLHGSTGALFVAEG